MKLLGWMILATLPGWGADWDARRAAEYLDGRQKAWFGWAPALAGIGGPCLSCHTGLPYLLARPGLRRALGEKAATAYETGLVDAVRKRMPLDRPEQLAPQAKEPRASQVLGVEAVLAALVLVKEDGLSKDAERALERMWASQVREGPERGSWRWFSLELDPWEEQESSFYGASLAAVAVGLTPKEYWERPAVRAGLDRLRDFLRSRQTGQPLHNRLTLAWAAVKLPGLLSAAARRSIVEEALRAQAADGGWTLESLGPWRAHPSAPKAEGSSAYATAYATFLLRQAGVGTANAGMRRAVEWLKSRQDAQGGYWEASSMNKAYRPEGMPILFMRDAATAYAVLALQED